MKKKCVAMLLAGGQGSRLGLLTKTMAKPAVPFGGRYRIIDFPLSNCANSHIDTVGVLTQYQPLALNSYIGSGTPWDLDISDGGVFILPPYARAKGADWYKGTANAVYQNFSFIDEYDPEYVLVLSGDHIYRMDYNSMLEAHINHNADLTIAVRHVPIEEAHAFGIMTTDGSGRIIEFTEKPAHPTSDLANIGVYIFSWPVMKKYLTEDDNDPKSENDFGKNIIPKMISDGKNVISYAFDSYWKDVGTIENLWRANMDLLDKNCDLHLNDTRWPIYARSAMLSAQYIGKNATIHNSLISDGCTIHGTVEHSVVSTGVTIESGAVVRDCFIMPGTHILSGARLERAIAGVNCTVGEAAVIGASEGDITLIGPETAVLPGTVVPAGVQFSGAPEDKTKAKTEIKN